MSEFFINRPIFSWVIAMLIMLGGVISILRLPITQYPNVAPPAVVVNGMYPGASAQTVQDTVVQVIEQQMSGLDGFRYMSSSSTSDGSFEIILTFEQRTNPDIAQVQVQNKLQQATPLLPTEVQSQGVRVTKYQTNFMLILALYCEDDRLSEGDIADYMSSGFKDTLSRINGVGIVEVWGTQYAMRVWLQPDRLYSYNLIPQDIINAIESQNIQVSSGQIGGLPALDNTQISATIVAKSRLTTVEQFRNILVKVNSNGSQVRLKDVAEIELGNEHYNFSTRLNGYSGVGLGMRLAPGANILDTTQAVYDTIEKLKPHLPSGMKIAYVSEIAPIVRESIQSVIKTLFEAIFLVFLVMWLFLQRFRITLIPTLTVPIVLLGTFAMLYLFGFTINVITMFAMVLVIGLLVDDAIVVVENVERLLADKTLSVKETVRKSMKQIQGALVGVGLVISAVFFPMIFFGGSTGVIYRQFSVTVIAAMSLSVLIALTFTPALCASMLRPASEHRKIWFAFRWFNEFFVFMTNCYVQGVGLVLRHRVWSLVSFAIFVAMILVLYPKLPTAFLPVEDRGEMSILVELPPNATMQRTKAVMDQITDYFLNEEQESVEKFMTVVGFSFAGMSQNSGMVFLAMKPFDQRHGKGQDVFSVVERSSRAFAKINDARITPLIPPSISELGNVAGINFFLQDQAGMGHKKLKEAQNSFLRIAQQSGTFAAIWSNELPDEPQYRITIDEEKARILGMSLMDVNRTMSTVWGSTYVNDFVDRGRVKKVYAQGEVFSRTTPEDLGKWYVRNTHGQMVPFRSFSSGEWVIGSPKLARYNGFSGVEILGVGAEGVSSGVAMDKIEELATKLPVGVGLSFTGLSFEERQAGNQAFFLYGLSLLIVFLCLAALYESWSVPAAVLLVVPFGVLGAIIATLCRGLANDVYFQVGMLTVMGLSSKNAILIVEFAKKMYEQEGKSLYEATILAARMRLRPIIMTSMVFVLGVLPMTFAYGASSVSQHSLGTSVIGGTLVATFLAIFFVPLFYVLVAGLFPKKTTHN
ncbi:MAG: efflux RND transporter permease subunit [Planctomycetaceae bacterium]|jgi:multidrug efflux pump|nr:efflux RND transporter permease subunit [Planctomycetaceae bacterium]